MDVYRDHAGAGERDHHQAAGRGAAAGSGEESGGGASGGPSGSTHGLPGEAEGVGLPAVTRVTRLLAGTCFKKPQRGQRLREAVTRVTRVTCGLWKR